MQFSTLKYKQNSDTSDLSFQSPLSIKRRLIPRRTLQLLKVGYIVHENAWVESFKRGCFQYCDNANCFPARIQFILATDLLFKQHNLVLRSDVCFFSLQMCTPQTQIQIWLREQRDHQQ